MAPLLDFCNRLADDVAQVYPGVKIITYAYEYSHILPANMTAGCSALYAGWAAFLPSADHQVSLDEFRFGMPFSTLWLRSRNVNKNIS